MFKIQLIVSEYLENLSDYLLMFLNSHCEDHDVIHVDHYLSSIDQILEEVVHHCLKDG